MQVRVFDTGAGAVRILRPNWAHQHENETPEAFLARLAAKDATLDGLPFVDLDDSTLPPRDRACVSCGDGTRHSVRDQWRLVGGAVVRDATAPNPVRDALHEQRDDLATLRTAAESDPVIAALLRVILRRTRR